MIGRANGSPAAPAMGTPNISRQGKLWSLLFGKTESLLQQFCRYFVVGGAAFLVDFGALYLLTEFAGLHYLISAAVAFLLGLVVNYCLSRFWVFNRHTMESVRAEFLVFAVIGIVGLGLNHVIMWLAAERSHLHYMVAKLISASIVFLWNFGARKAVLFR